MQHQIANPLKKRSAKTTEPRPANGLQKEPDWQAQAPILRPNTIRHQEINSAVGAPGLNNELPQKTRQLQPLQPSLEPIRHLLPLGQVQGADRAKEPTGGQGQGGEWIGIREEQLIYLLQVLLRWLAQSRPPLPLPAALKITQPSSFGCSRSVPKQERGEKMKENWQ